MSDIEASYQEYAARQVQQLIRQDKEIAGLRADNERLRAGAERDAKTIGELQYVLFGLLLCKIDDKAEALIRRALENKP